MINVTLKQLRYFEALSQHRHFGRAAKACSVSQPALSMQIRELESILGVKLFERGVRTVRLTRFGEDFSDRAIKVLRQVEELEDLARASNEMFAGRLRLGIIPTIAPYLLPAIVEQLNQQYETIDIHVRETLTGKLVEDLLDGKLDTAIVALPISEPLLTELPLFKENFVLVRPQRDQGLPVPDRNKLQEMRLLLLEEGHCFRDQALSFCNMHDSHPRELLDGSSLSTLVQMVGSGMGVTLIPEMAVEIETRSADVCISRFKAPQPSRHIGMVWRQTSPLAEQLAQVAELVKGVAQDKMVTDDHA